MTDFTTHDTTHLDGRTRRGEVTRERLLAAAVELFGSQGFEATSMKELAAAAGVRLLPFTTTSNQRKHARRGDHLAS